MVHERLKNSINNIIYYNNVILRFKILIVS